MKILVTGANGFIGRNIAKYFIDSGHEVIGWDLKANTFNGVQIKQVNLLSIDEIEENLNSDYPEILIHCAGSADVSKSVTNPEIDFAGNVQATHNLLFSLYKNEMKSIRFVMLSSAAVYGNPKSLPILEKGERNPLSPYALHKQMCEDICKYFVFNYNMDIKIIRIFSAYGAGLGKQIFWDMFQKAKNTGELTMFGTGNESRDFINIADVTQALYLIATKAPRNEMIYNVANGLEITIREIAEIFAKSYGIAKSNISFSGHTREGDPINWKADITKCELLGYKQKVDIEQGIEEYVEWAREFS